MANQQGLWKKRVLVPFWTVRIFIMLSLIAVYAYALRTIDGVGELAKPAIASVVVFMLFIAICLLIDVLAIVLFMRDALKPGTFLTMNCFQTGFFGGVVIMQIVTAMKGRSEAGIGFSVFVFFTFFSLLMYSAVTYHRAKQEGRRGYYAAANNPAVYHPAVPTEYAPPYQQSTAYYPPSATPLDRQQSQYPPPYQSNGAMNDQYIQQPLKPAHMA
ncbi:hypothetical protein E8E13_006921 [Curvularia kusanoi]|uniref:MARVEL domain-containing protein n=1 Tax=Curvularia kusanoi TaxID=90978 RepID=A0A9P4TJY1_CURKU|nr:hypothetical protein E8E13_006921 [Curvularia kusanoi]